MNFRDRFSKSIQVLSFMKSVQWELGCYMCTDRQTWWS